MKTKTQQTPVTLPPVDPKRSIEEIIEASTVESFAELTRIRDTDPSPIRRQQAADALLKHGFKMTPRKQPRQSDANFKAWKEWAEQPFDLKEEATLVAALIASGRYKDTFTLAEWEAILEQAPAELLEEDHPV
jgi:hypothetical protein